MARKRTGVARLSDGFYITASDLYRALYTGDFLGSELLLLGAAHEMAWAPGLLDGSREARPFRLNLSHLARVSGFHRETLRLAHRRLEMYRVFLASEPEDGTHWINKRYNEWLDSDGSPRFSPGQIAWIVEPGPGGSGCNAPTSSSLGVRTPNAAREPPPAPRCGCVITPPFPQAHAPSPLDGAGTGDAFAGAKKIQKEEKTPPEPPQGGGTPKRSRGPRRKTRGMDWDALEEALREEEDHGDGSPET